MENKKELKEKYKELKLKKGVYLIRNSINNKVFVGSNLNLDAIWNRHKFLLNFGSHPNKLLQKEWNEFGQEKFIFEIISEIKQDDTITMNYQKEIKKLEAMFIDELQPFDEKGYNAK